MLTKEVPEAAGPHPTARPALPGPPHNELMDQIVILEAMIGTQGFAFTIGAKCLGEFSTLDHPNL